METKLEKVNMDDLSLNDQLSLLLRGEMVNRFHLSTMLDQEDFMKIQCLSLRITSTLYGLICTVYLKEEELLKLMEGQLKSAVIELMKITELLLDESKLNFDWNKKNAH